MKDLTQLKKDADQAKKDYAHYFQSIDRGGTMPTWYNQAHIEEENDWIKRAQKQLEQNLVPQDDILNIKAQLKIREKRLKSVLASRMETEKLILKNKDKSYAEYKELGEKIGNSMFSHDEMHYVSGKHGQRARVISPREEAEREIHRKHLVKKYKILGKVLGEDTNIERLRKGRDSG
jgi:hypothetical protein